MGLVNRFLNFWGHKNNSASVNSDDDVINFIKPDSNKYVSADKALLNSDIYSILMQLSGDLASAELIANTSRAQAILNNPSQSTNSHAFWQSIYAQLLLGGEAFAYRWRNQNGTESRWEYLRPSQVSPMLLDDGSGLIYNISFDEPDIGVMKAVPQANVIHFRLLSRNGGLTGVSPLIALTDELRINKRSNDLTMDALDRSVNVPSVLKIQHGSLLESDDKAARSRAIVRQIKKSNGGPLVIDDLETYTPLEIKNNVAQLLDQVNWTSTQIAKVYGVPDSYLNGSGDQQSSLDMTSRLYTTALKRYMNSILSELNNKLNTAVEVNLRPAVDPLGDSYATQISNLAKQGVLAQNQALNILQQTGYLPQKLPKVETAVSNSKGGEDDEDS